MERLPSVACNDTNVVERMQKLHVLLFDIAIHSVLEVTSVAQFHFDAEALKGRDIQVLCMNTHRSDDKDVCITFEIPLAAMAHVKRTLKSLLF